MFTDLDEKGIKQRRALQEMARNYRQSQILLTCVELGVFDALAKRSASAAEVSATLSVDKRGLELLLNAATSLGFLEKHDTHFCNSTLTEAQLTWNAAGGLGQSLRLESAFYHRWGNLAKAVRTGKRPEENRNDEQPDDWVKTFIRALYAVARPLAPAIAEALALAENRPLQILDVGGGHGGYSIALAQRYPLLTATVFELPRVAHVAREIIENAGLTTRITVQEGDFQQEGLGSDYDVALVFGVLNGEPPEDRPVLIRKVFAALNPGGLIVLRDSILEPDRTGPSEAAIFALQMLITTDSGGLDTSDDWATWLLSAGFSHLKQVALPEWVGSYLTIAEKPLG
jgi:SAM-dependent methyltransferase